MDFIAAEVRNAPIDPTCLIFEVTETAAIANIDRARSPARGLADLGCQFALDEGSRKDDDRRIRGRRSDGRDAA
jgi:EAL domain-containing protein (putative c-di-GMP-specific phosphodiesterase class I)